MQAIVTAAALEELQGMLAQELKERRVNPVFVPIINQYLDGIDIEEIARSYGLQPLEVSLVLERNEVKNYINQAIQSVGYLNRLKRVRLINKVIDKAIQDAEEYDAPYSRKDLLDWIKLLQEETKVGQQNMPRTAIQVNQTGKSNMLNLMQDLLEESE